MLIRKERDFILKGMIECYKCRELGLVNREGGWKE